MDNISATNRRCPLSRMKLRRRAFVERASSPSPSELAEALNRYVSVLRLARHVASRGTMEHWREGLMIEELVYQSIPAWAAHPDQTLELIEMGFSRVRQEVSQFPSLRDALLTQQFMV